MQLGVNGHIAFQASQVGQVCCNVLQVKALSEELENPLNVHRWRKLEGSDPQAYEMILKIQTLQKRLILKSEEVTYTYMMPIKKAHTSLLYNVALGDFDYFYQLIIGLILVVISQRPFALCYVEELVSLTPPWCTSSPFLVSQDVWHCGLQHQVRCIKQA